MTEELTGELHLGKVLKPHGLKGGVVVFPYGAETLWEAGELVLISPEPKGGRRVVTVCDRMELPNGNMVLFIKGVQYRDQAEELRNSIVAVSRESLAPCEEGEVYLTDLIGAMIRLESGEAIGTVTGIYETPTPYPMLTYQDVRDGEEHFLPLPRENFIDFLEEERIILVAWSMKPEPPK